MKTGACEMYRLMRLIRRFEETVVELVNSNEIGGVTHEYVGQEATAVGTCIALNRDDVITSTHRGHGHVIAKGGSVDRMLAELLGREQGMNKGRGGSMHIADVGLGIYGANGIVAAGAPIAAGAALAVRYRKQPRVALTYFGDGGANQGVLFETLNLAVLWNLPIVFVCENNGYAATVPVSVATAVPSIADRARGFGMPSETVDGMDCRSVRAAAGAAVGRARAGDGPSFLECKTYRFVGHHTAERLMKLGYRSDEEVEQWKQRDPLILERAVLIESGEATEEEIETVEADVEETLVRAVAYARAGTEPDPASARDYMYASGHVPVGGWAAR
jgi:acetoin:2,6-dichlorophenolindophenol oxidoreductase subunit alpha